MIFCTHVEYAPAEPRFFLLLRQIFVFSYFLGCLGLKGFHMSGEKDNKNTHTSVNGSPGAHKTRAKFQGLNSSNGVNIWTFVR